MIFARRAIQRRLDELRPVLGENVTAQLAARLNTPGTDRLAVMWEVVILHALSKLGTLQHEVALASGRRPDVRFKDGDLLVNADITAVSDKSLHEQNPVEELIRLIEQAKARLGLPIGGVSVAIESSTQYLPGGHKISLRMPERKRLTEFVRDKVVPEIKRLIESGTNAPTFTISDGDALLHLSIDPSRSPYNNASYAAYNLPFVRNRNPLYRTLHDKAKQLRGALGIVGIIVGDGDSATLANLTGGPGALGGRAIAEEFLRQHPSVHFVLLLSVEEPRFAWHQARPTERRLVAELVQRKSNSPPAELETLVLRMVNLLPKPIAMPGNAARRAKEPSFGLGHHGGYKMSENRVQVSTREVFELLAGRSTVEEINHTRDELSDDESIRSPNTLPRLIELYLSQGRMPTKISIIKTGDDDSDDWMEFEFGPPDPAITPFR